MPENRLSPLLVSVDAFDVMICTCAILWRRKPKYCVSLLDPDALLPKSCVLELASMVMVTPFFVVWSALTML